MGTVRMLESIHILYAFYISVTPYLVYGFVCSDFGE